MAKNPFGDKKSDKTPAKSDKKLPPWLTKKTEKTGGKPGKSGKKGC